jgi:transposase
MYLRKNSRYNRDGSEVSYLQIAENTWDPAKKRSTAKVVCSLGRAGDEQTERRLRQLAASIRRHGSFETIAELEEGWQFVNSWEYGGFYVIERLWQWLGIGKLIAEAQAREDRSVPFERASFVMVANRCLAPMSKLGCYEQWLAEDVYFPEGEEIALHHLYRAMDFLASRKEEIEEKLYWQLADLLSMDVDLIFYDTTSVHFAIDDEDEEEEEGDGLRFRGYAKKGGEGDPQIVVGMAVTRDGYPVKSWVFPGNTADVTTIERVKADLRGWKLNRCIFVADAGMVSEDNLRTLALGGTRYVVAMPCKKGTEVVEEVLSRPGRYQDVKENLRVKEVFVGAGERKRRYVVCHNPREAERQKRHREEVLEALEAELATLAGGNSKRACQLMASRRYGPYLRRLKGGDLRIDRGAVRERAKRDGRWVIRSNDEELSAEDLGLAYKQLMRVEEGWKTLKSILKIRPIWHRTPERIRAHVFLCVLALLLERVAEKACGATWPRIRQELRSIKVGQLLAPQGTVYQTCPGSIEARNILRMLKIDLPPLVLKAE